MVLLEESKPKILTFIEPTTTIYTDLASPSSAKESIVPKTREINIMLKIAAEWRPGLTEKGEKILVIAPTEMEDILRNPIIIKYSFLIKKKG